MNNDLLNTVAFIIWIALLSLFLIGFARAQYKLNKVAKDLEQAQLDKISLESHMTEMFNQIEEMKVEQSDGFLKFLSQSRDWAYQYIDTVQESFAPIYKTITTKLSNEVITINDKKEISEALDKMKTLILPEETKTPNN